jgi:hypothetical protein
MGLEVAAAALAQTVETHLEVMQLDLVVTEEMDLLLLLLVQVLLILAVAVAVEHLEEALVIIMVLVVLEVVGQEMDQVERQIQVVEVAAIPLPIVDKVQVGMAVLAS